MFKFCHMLLEIMPFQIFTFYLGISFCPYKQHVQLCVTYLIGFSLIGLFFSSRELCEPLELQLDYWLVPNAYKEMATRSNEPNKRMDTKFTLKTGFKSLHISRLFLTNEEPLAFFTVSYIKEKKQKSKYSLQAFSNNNVFGLKILNCFSLNEKIT